MTGTCTRCGAPLNWWNRDRYVPWHRACVADLVRSCRAAAKEDTAPDPRPDPVRRARTALVLGAAGTALFLLGLIPGLGVLRLLGILAWAACFVGFIMAQPDHLRPPEFRGKTWRWKR